MRIHPSLFLLTLLLFCLSAKAQKATGKAWLAQQYTQAIADFIEAANRRNNASFDTVFILNRQNNQPDDFPDITLPARIANTPVRLTSPTTGAAQLAEHRKRTYINLIGWTGSKHTEFIFVVFTNGFSHQYDCRITYSCNASAKTCVQKSLEFKLPAARSGRSE